jgi:hypothetical protein
MMRKSKAKAKTVKKPSAKKSPAKRKAVSKKTKPAAKRKVASKAKKGLLTSKIKHRIGEVLTKLEALLDKLESKTIKKFS